MGLFHEVLLVTGSGIKSAHVWDLRLQQWLADCQTSLTHSIVLSQQSKFSMMRDLNYSKLTLCCLQTVAMARGKVYQVNILVVCSHSKAKEDSQHNSDSEEAHSMASSSTSESDSLPVSSVCKAQRWYKSQFRWLNIMKVKLFFRASCGWIGATRLYALPSAVPVPIQNCFLRPCTVPAPPLQHS